MADVLVGSVVQYQLSAADAATINKTRTSHVGSSAAAGNVVPLIVTAVNEYSTKPPTVKINGHAVLEGHHQPFLVIGRRQGTLPGTWQVPAPPPAKPVAAKPAPVPFVSAV